MADNRYYQRSLYEKLSAVSFLSYLSSTMSSKTQEKANPYYHNCTALDLHAAGAITSEELERLLIDPMEATSDLAPPSRSRADSEMASRV